MCTYSAVMASPFPMDAGPIYPASVMTLRCQQACFIREACLTPQLRASPQAKASLLRLNLSQVHGQSMMRTSDFQRRVSLDLCSILGDEVSDRAGIADEAIGLRTGVGKRLRRVNITA